MRRTLFAVVPAVAAAVALAACGSSSSSKSTSASSSPSQTTASQQTNGASGTVVVKSASNAALGKAVLTNAQGMTLYALSAESGGKFICTSSACLKVWHPLTVPASAHPSGSVGSLATVKRPDGSMQVTFQGKPLYTFAQDQSPGDVNGQGIKDVGTWDAVQTSTATTAAASQQAPATTSAPSSGYSY